MPTARELLLQADALMRNNRSAATEGSAQAVPTLTDVAVPGAGSSRALFGGEEVPVLTQVVRPATEPTMSGSPASDTATRYLSPADMRDTTLFGPSRLPPTTVQKPFAEDAPFEPLIDPALLGIDADEPVMRTGPTGGAPFARPAGRGDSDAGSSVVPSRATESRRVEAPATMENIPDFPPVEELLPPFDHTDPGPVVSSAFAPLRSSPAHVPAAPVSPAQASPAAPAPPVSGRVTAPPAVVAASSAPIVPSIPAPTPAPAAVVPVPVPTVPTPSATAAPVATSPAPVAPVPAPVAPAPPPALAPTPAAAPAPSAGELAEAVYFQVLQNLDLHTERMLQRELTVPLAPIIERANQELMATLNANLAGLIRQFIADAIEKQLGARPDEGPRT